VAPICLDPAHNPNLTVSTFVNDEQQKEKHTVNQFLAA
jgi:hypothetical protein